jgi:hypothetical protein
MKNPPLKDQKEDCASRAKEIGRNSSILRLARKLCLHPRPSGIDEFSWYADCPGCGGKLSISTQTKSFSCMTCVRSGNTHELASFHSAIVREKFAGLVSVIEKQIGSIDNLKSIEFEASWYYDLIQVTLRVTRKEWDEIITGLNFAKKGRGYMSEEGFCQDYWHFNYTGPGLLEVSYDDGGQGFVGSIEDAFSKVEHYRSARPQGRKRGKRV